MAKPAKALKQNFNENKWRTSQQFSLTLISAIYHKEKLKQDSGIELIEVKGKTTVYWLLAKIISLFG